MVSEITKKAVGVYKKLAEKEKEVEELEAKLGKIVSQIPDEDIVYYYRETINYG